MHDPKCLWSRRSGSSWTWTWPILEDSWEGPLCLHFYLKKRFTIRDRIQQNFVKAEPVLLSEYLLRKWTHRPGRRLSEFLSISTSSLRFLFLACSTWFVINSCLIFSSIFSFSWSSRSLSRNGWSFSLKKKKKKKISSSAQDSAGERTRHQHSSTCRSRQWSSKENEILRNYFACGQFPKHFSFFLKTQ